MEASGAWKKEAAWKSSVEERRRGEPRKRERRGRGGASKSAGAARKRGAASKRGVLERERKRRLNEDGAERVSNEREAAAMMQRQREEWRRRLERRQERSGVKSGDGARAEAAESRGGMELYIYIREITLACSGGRALSFVFVFFCVDDQSFDSSKTFDNLSPTFGIVWDLV